MSRTPKIVVGSYVVDKTREVVAQVMGHEGPHFQLRPPKGGCEWEAVPEDVRPATLREVLRAKVQAANEASRGWRL
ncbi:hypothetical protein [Streptomyces sp. UNOC14_S4]|uniref:hypothetical protein n=1 Tax=Streptomyces sp. UNOC14_S4 TaxID=2872340 RepID=UPI001E3D4AF5|nr:hypothetical protein [Streptomyces sp. UNOC14_S4]MCC3773192.1 hypothetical protein [Streptomyces sp. UNOC14_S4]